MKPETSEGNVDPAIAGIRISRRAFCLGTVTAMAAGCSSDSPPEIPSDLRVMTYNLHHGEGVDGRLDLERIARVIRAANPDLVALQEVDRNAARTGGMDQAAEYSRLTGLYGAYGAAMPFQGGEYGQALLSRWPLEDFAVIQLPGTRGKEPRIAVSAWVEIPRLGRIRWIGTHLDAGRDDADRWDQAGALVEILGRDSAPTLLVGDFNATPESRVMDRLLNAESPWDDTASEAAAPTVPAEEPKARIDYILGSPRGTWQTLVFRVIPESVASDHRPVFAILRRADGDQRD
ncbi:MAG: endonuclease/exonuclease/phosphatase family protein [Limisphaerales bacterium]